MKKRKYIPSISFHNSTKIDYLKKEGVKQEYPITWTKIFFKTYPRFSKIGLLNVRLPKKSFQTIIGRRTSTRKFRDRPVTLKEISQILEYSAGIINKSKRILPDETNRPYPSAGARYPLEVYVAILNSKEISPGLYHYNVKAHYLELLMKKNLKDFFDRAIKQDMIKKANFLILISSVFSRTKVKYGERSYRYILMEAGHLAQNLYLIASLLDIGCCTIGGFIDDKINEVLDFISNEEAVLYIAAFGGKDEKK